MLGRYVYLHAVAHVEHLVHLAPGCATFLLNEVKEGRNGEKVVLYNMLVVDKVHYLGLGTAGAVNHSVDGRTHLGKKFLYDRGVGAGGGEYETTGVNGGTFHRIGEVLGAGVDKILGDGSVKSLGIFGRKVFLEYIVAG